MIDRRGVLVRGAATGVALGLPASLGAFVADGVPDLSHVDPELRTVAARLLALPRTAPEVSTLPEQRAAMARGGQPFSDAVPVERRMVSGRRGQPDVPVYVLNAHRGAARPAILHIHGGGFVAGRAQDNVRALQEHVAVPLDCVVVTVDYRLAPETDWRGSVEDNYAALKWLHANAAAFGIDRTRIAVMGESAGGGHAALLAIAARDRGEVPLVFQCLTYPMLDDRTGSSRPVPPFIGTIIHRAENNRFGWRSFLGMEPGGPGVPAAAVPARVADLTGLPPAFIGVGGIDLFVDEDMEYARRLNDAGVPVQQLLAPGAYHGFDIFVPQARISRWFNASRLDALRAALAPRPDGGVNPA